MPMKRARFTAAPNALRARRYLALQQVTSGTHLAGQKNLLTNPCFSLILFSLVEIDDGQRGMPHHVHRCYWVCLRNDFAEEIIVGVFRFQLDTG